jgi:hypothetical protein
MQHIDYVAYLGQIDCPIPSAFIGLFQLINACPDGTHAASLAGSRQADLKLAKRKPAEPT